MPYNSSNNKNDLVLIHGWGMNQSCWDAVQACLDSKYSLHIIPLPGHGKGIDTDLSLSRPKEFIRSLLAQIPANAIWVGWSLGALVAQLAATQFPQKIAKIMCISMSACFASRANWKAVPTSFLHDMHNQLNTQPKECMDLFIQHQYHGCTPAQQDSLNAMARTPYLLEELHAGLDWLANTDLRADLSQYLGTALFVTGTHDPICPATTVRHSATLCPKARCKIILKAGHALPISHPRTIAQQIEALSAL